VRASGGAGGPTGTGGAAAEASHDAGRGVRALVNGEWRDLDAGVTVADVVALVAESSRGVAVAIDREVVPRSTWTAVTVPDGARIEVVTAAAGG